MGWEMGCGGQEGSTDKLEAHCAQVKLQGLGCSSVAYGLPGKHEVLGSIPGTKKKEKKTK